jgi:hypothetical protein
MDICRKKYPDETALTDKHRVSCWLFGEAGAEGGSRG